MVHVVRDTTRTMQCASDDTEFNAEMALSCERRAKSRCGVTMTIGSSSFRAPHHVTKPAVRDWSIGCRNWIRRPTFVPDEAILTNPSTAPCTHHQPTPTAPRIRTQCSCNAPPSLRLDAPPSPPASPPAPSAPRLCAVRDSPEQEWVGKNGSRALD